MFGGAVSLFLNGRQIRQPVMARMCLPFKRGDAFLSFLPVANGQCLSLQRIAGVYAYPFLEEIGVLSGTVGVSCIFKMVSFLS